MEMLYQIIQDFSTHDWNLGHTWGVLAYLVFGVVLIDLAIIASLGSRGEKIGGTLFFFVLGGLLVWFSFHIYGRSQEERVLSYFTFVSAVSFFLMCPVLWLTNRQ